MGNKIYLSALNAVRFVMPSQNRESIQIGDDKIVYRSPSPKLYRQHDTAAAVETPCAAIPRYTRAPLVKFSRFTIGPPKMINVNVTTMLDMLRATELLNKKYSIGKSINTEYQTLLTKIIIIENVNIHK